MTKTDATGATAPVAWRYKCSHDDDYVIMEKRLTAEQMARGYYTGEDGEDEVDGDEAIVGPFHWAEETPLYAVNRDSQFEAMVGALREIERLSDNCVNAERYGAEEALEDLQAIRSVIKRLVLSNIQASK